MFLTDLDDRRRLMYFAVFALVLRSAIVWYGFDSFASDPDAYRALAETLSETGVYGLPKINPNGEAVTQPTAFRPPLYPFLLSWLNGGGKLSTTIVAVLHVALGFATIVFSVLTCSRLLESSRIGRSSILAGLLVTIDPILVQQSTLIMTETIATALSMAIIWLWVRSISNGFGILQAILLGLLLALAYLCRPPFLVWAFLLVVATPFAVQGNWTTRLSRSIVIGSLVAVALVSWTYRNAKAIGHPIWATSHGGYTLLLANNPSFYEYLKDGPMGEAWDAQAFLNAYIHRYDGDPNRPEFWQEDWPAVRTKVDSQNAPVTEHQDDQRCYLAARATIGRQPTMFAWSCVVRCGRLWSPIPHHTPGRSWVKLSAVGAFYTMIYIGALIALWRFRRQIFRREWWAIWALAVTLSAVHAVYWSNIRMRSPLIPAIALVACGAIVRPSEGTVDVAND